MTSEGELRPCGFLSLSEAHADDEYASLWRVARTHKSVEMSATIVALIGDAFAAVCRDEMSMRDRFANNNNKPEADGGVWKRLAADTREMCDQCNTSIFNGHMACLDCGFSVCFECYTTRLRLHSKCGVGAEDDATKQEAAAAAATSTDATQTSVKKKSTKRTQTRKKKKKKKKKTTTTATTTTSTSTTRPPLKKLKKMDDDDDNDNGHDDHDEEPDRDDRDEADIDRLYDEWQKCNKRDELNKKRQRRHTPARLTYVQFIAPQSSCFFVFS